MAERLTPSTATARAEFARARERRISPEKRSLVLELLGDESLSRNEIARRAGVAPNTVKKLAEEAGRSFDRSATEAATVARAIDARARRAQLADALVEDALVLRALIGRQAETRGMADVARSLAYVVQSADRLDQLAFAREQVSAKNDTRAAEIDRYLAWMSGAAEDAPLPQTPQETS